MRSEPAPLSDAAGAVAGAPPESGAARLTRATLRNWRLGAAGRDPWHDPNAVASLRRSLSLVTLGTAAAMLAAIGGLVITLDVVVPSLTPAGNRSWSVVAVQALLVAAGAAGVLVLALLLRERRRLRVLESELSTEHARDEEKRRGLATQAEHMRVVLGVAERLAGDVSLEDIAAVVAAAARAITGAPGARLLMMHDTGLVPVLGQGTARARSVEGWAIPLVVSGEVVGVLELAGIRKPPPAVATVAEALAGHAAGAVEVARRYEMLREAIYVDSLTGLPNRGALDVTLVTECDRANRTGGDLAVVMIDIDHFKIYNDSYGHGQGDAALRAVARVLAKGLRRRGDGAFRYGGEEFAIVLPGTDGESGVAVAERLRQAVAGAAGAGFLEYPVTASFGVCGRTGDRRSPADLLAAADSALYQAKEQGRDRVVRCP